MWGRIWSELSPLVVPAALPPTSYLIIGFVAGKGLTDRAGNISKYCEHFSVKLRKMFKEEKKENMNDFVEPARRVCVSVSLIGNNISSLHPRPVNY